MTTYLSTNFTLEEFTHSQEAARSGIDNTPNAEQLENLYRTAYEMEMVRKELGGFPILISSGFRCLDLNRAIGSKDTSQHVRGQAVDFTCPRFGTPREIVEHLSTCGIDYDQLLLEYSRWVHISFSDRNRRQALTIDKDGVRMFA